MSLFQLHHTDNTCFISVKTFMKFLHEPQARGAAVTFFGFDIMTQKALELFGHSFYVGNLCLCSTC